MAIRWLHWECFWQCAPYPDSCIQKHKKMCSVVRNTFASKNGYKTDAENSTLSMILFPHPLSFLDFLVTGEKSQRFSLAMAYFFQTEQDHHCQRMLCRGLRNVQWQVCVEFGHTNDWTTKKKLFKRLAVRWKLQKKFVFNCKIRAWPQKRNYFILRFRKFLRHHVVLKVASQYLPAPTQNILPFLPGVKLLV